MRTTPSSILKLFMVGLDGVLPSRREWARDPSTPMPGCGKKLSTKKGAGPAELGDGAAPIQ